MKDFKKTVSTVTPTTEKTILSNFLVLLRTKKALKRKK